MAWRARFQQGKRKAQHPQIFSNLLHGSTWRAASFGEAGTRSGRAELRAISCTARLFLLRVVFAGGRRLSGGARKCIITKFRF